MEFNEKYYDKVMQTNGYNPMDFSPMNFWFNGISPEIMKMKWLCHSGINVQEEYNNTIITTGIGLSGTPHMGTLSQMLRIIFLQKNGFDVQMVLGDLDSYNARNQKFQIVEERAKSYKEFIEALGFDNKKGVLRNQFEHEEVARTAFLLSKYLENQDFYDTEEDLSELYIKRKIYKGINFPVEQAILLMISDFIHLGLFYNYKNVIVMLGLEEHKYVLLARKLLDRMKLNFSLCGMYSRIINGLNGFPKMSKSIPESSITVDMKKDQIADKIMKEKNVYDIPENSVIYQLMTSISYYSPEELNNLYLHCKNKDSEWEDIKVNYIDELSKICEIWRKIVNGGNNN